VFAYDGRRLPKYDAESLESGASSNFLRNGLLFGRQIEMMGTYEIIPISVAISRSGEIMLREIFTADVSPGKGLGFCQKTGFATSFLIKIQ